MADELQPDPLYVEPIDGELLEEVPPPANDSGEPSRESGPAPNNIRPKLPPRLGSILAPAIDRAMRRSEGIENPLPTPWSTISDLIGGGLWPGLHVLVSGTGAGKTQLALQLALSAAKAGHPTGYVGLELDEMQIALRLLGGEANVPWSALCRGSKALNAEHFKRLDAAEERLRDLPFYPEFAPPSGWPPSRLRELAIAMREEHPEPNGVGSLPMLIVVDFMQLFGNEPNTRHTDLRERIGAAAYAAREVARTLNICVLCISSAARASYGLLAGAVEEAGIGYAQDKSGVNVVPLRPTIARPDVLVGLGKESGEIEFAADSVIVAIKAWSAQEGRGTLLAIPKQRTGPATWGALFFDGHAFYELSGDEETELALWLESAKRKRRQPKDESEGASVESKEEKIRAEVLRVIAKNMALRSANDILLNFRKGAPGDRNTRLKVIADMLRARVIDKDANGCFHQPLPPPNKSDERGVA